MPVRQRTADDSDQQESDGGYFAPLAPARYMRLTTFKRDGTPESASVHGAVDGDRAYFHAGNRSGIVQRLKHTGAVQVTPCGVLGFCTYGPPLDAIARLLPGEDAEQVAAELDRKHPVWNRFLTSLRRRQTAYYELLADDAAGNQGVLAEDVPASLTATMHTGQVLMSTDAATPTSLTTVCTPSTPSRHSPSGYTRITTVSISLARTQAARRSAGGS
ncbi:MAG: hypothetical protein ACRDNW_03595 [Trebonia sp.]